MGLTQLQITERLREFGAFWNDRWTKPRDWSEAEIAKGTSSYCWYRSTLSQERTSVRVLLECLDTFKDDRFPPKPWKVKALYARRTNAHAERQLAPCGQCESTGFLVVPVVGVRGTVHLVRQPIPVRNVNTTAVPCRCSRGRLLASGFPWCGEDDQAWQRAIDARVSPTTLATLRAECRALCGVTTPDRQTFGDEGEWVAAVQRLRAMGDDLGRHVGQLVADSEVRKGADSWWDDRDEGDI